MPDITGDQSCRVDRLPVLISSLDDGGAKLLGAIDAILLHRIQAK